MKKRIFSILVPVLCLSLLTGCFCKHETWLDADCVTPKTCAKCGETEGEALGHVWMAATCEAPKTCEACGETEGNAKGHSWVEATCETAKTCSVCNKTEGEALGHTWIDATTETPKTCETCALTEGERIITDPRFTTAATRDLYGKWVADLDIPSEMLGIEGFEGAMTVQIYIDLDNKGTMGLGYTITNIDEFNASLSDYLEALLYTELESAGLDKTAADEAMVDEYGMTVPEYADAVVKELNLAAIFEAFNISGVYYVEGNTLYTGISWDSTLEPSEFTLEGDTLVLGEELSGLSEESITFSRNPG